MPTQTEVCNSISDPYSRTTLKVIAHYTRRPETRPCMASHPCSRLHPNGSCRLAVRRGVVRRPCLGLCGLALRLEDHTCVIIGVRRDVVVRAVEGEKGGLLVDLELGADVLIKHSLPYKC